MPEKVTVGSSGSCDSQKGWCMYRWDVPTRVFILDSTQGGCTPGHECPVPNPNAYGGSEELDGYEEFRAIVCCQSST